jgi:hypothetical protein
VIVPTIGRPTLAATLSSLRRQARPTELEIIVVGDTHAGTWGRVLAGAPPTCEAYGAYYVEHDGGSHCYGQQQRQHGQALARGHWLAWLQDDDVWSDGALAGIRPFLQYQRPLLFKAATRFGGVVWREPGLELGNVDANCLVVPNDPARLGRWGLAYTGDYDMIRETVAHWGGCYWPAIQIADHLRGEGE